MNNMSPKDVVKLMKLSRNEEEWNENCDLIKVAFNGDYPDFWYKEIVLSGVMDKMIMLWRMA